jgi:tRNA(fMet)-specific endonuclease VapC
MYCLDTNIVIDILRNNESLREKAQNISGRGGLFITTITLCELYKGSYLSERIPFSLNMIEDFLEEVEVIDFNREACKEFGGLYVKLKNSGEMIPETDIMIASIVKENDLILVTRDKHFEKTGVKVEVW